MTSGSEVQILSVVTWFILVTFLQLSLYPLLKRWLSTIAFPAAFPLSLLLFVLISWYAAILGLPVLVGLVPFAILGVFHLLRGEYTREDLRRNWQYELIFLIFFLLMLELRFVNPAISSTEKFMDHAFIASIMRNPVVPPLDPWFSGGTLDMYYYLGYWLVAVLGLSSGVPSNIAFNLALPTVLATSAVSMYASGSLLIRRYRWLPLLVFITMNPAFFSHLEPGKGLGSVFWDSTRTISGTIHEYPLFSFLLGDVHPHVVGLVVQSALVLLLFFAATSWRTLSARARLATALLTALVLGIMLPTNIWDIFAYAPMILAFGVYIACKTGSWPFKRAATVQAGDGAVLPGTGQFRFPDTPLFLYWVVVPVVSVLISLPFILMLNTEGVAGLGLVTAPSDPVQFLLAEGLFLVILVATLARDIVRQPWFLVIPAFIAVIGYPSLALPALALVYLVIARFVDPEQFIAAAGIVVLAVCEIIYVKDSFSGSEFYRMNTVFKLSYVAWVLLGTSACIAAGRALEKLHLPVPDKKTGWAVLVMAVALLFIIPVAVSIDVPYGDVRTLDGMAYLDTAHPGDASAIAYLRALPGDHVIVEAVEGDYSYYSRISAFTGIPTIIGWPFHEIQWRSSSGEWFSNRTGAVQTIYEDPERSLAEMDRYGADILVVGDPEREKYKVSLPVSGLIPAFNSSGTVIYMRK